MSYPLTPEVLDTTSVTTPSRGYAQSVVSGQWKWVILDPVEPPRSSPWSRKLIFAVCGCPLWVPWADFPGVPLAVVKMLVDYRSLSLLLALLPVFVQSQMPMGGLQGSTSAVTPSSWQLRAYLLRWFASWARHARLPAISNSISWLRHCGTAE